MITNGQASVDMGLCKFSSTNVEHALDVYIYTNTYDAIRICVVMFEV